MTMAPSAGPPTVCPRACGGAVARAWGGPRDLRERRVRGGYRPAMTEHEEQRQGEGDEPPAEGEPGREEVAGQRGGQPGYDLDEGAAYEEAEEES